MNLTDREREIVKALRKADSNIVEYLGSAAKLALNSGSKAEQQANNQWFINRLQEILEPFNTEE